MAGAASKKRQRPTSKKEEETQKYYDTLLHMCQKDLNKQAKTIKNFECQKLIRKLKEDEKTASASASASTERVTTTMNTNTATKSTNKNEIKLQQLRDLPLEPVIRECLRRLGILTLNPKPNPAAATTTGSTRTNTKVDLTVENDEAETTHTDTDQVEDDSQNEEKGKDNEPSISTTGMEDTEYNKDWIEKILQHKRMREILEKWIEKVTEYRRWCVQQEEGTKKKGKKSRKGHVEEKQEEPTLQAEQLSNSLFVRLGDHPSDDDDSDEQDGDGDVAEMGDEKKKNRPGQRARKAKFDAKQLRKEGPVPDSFQRWMPSKKTTRTPNHPDSSNPHNGPNHGPNHGAEKKSSAPGTNAHANVRAHRTNSAATQRPKPAGALAEKDLHPSWKASKTQQASIVAFQGKKTTFD